VAHRLEGSVLRAGRRVRITAQLFQVSDQTHLWARQYERGVGDILAIQSDVATAIASEIKNTSENCAIGGTRSLPC